MFCIGSCYGLVACLQNDICIIHDRIFYEKYRGQPLSAQILEEFLLSKTTNALAVDSFHRFVYGFSDPSPSSELWLKDDTANTGSDDWGGTFWESPDLWIMNNDDGETDYQMLEYDQDCWFYALVRNKSSAGDSQHFVVAFSSRGFAVTEFVFPNDFFRQ
jgi:hypothetical protein